MTTIFKNTFVFFILIFIFMPLYLQARENVELGFIEKINGPTKDFFIARDEQKVKVALISPLYAEDKIIVLKKSNQLQTDNTNHLIINLGGNLKTITFQNSPYQIKREREINTVSGNVLQWVMGLFKDMHSNHHFAQTVSMVTKGEDETPPALTIPLLERDVTQALTIGKANMIYAWEGGTSPFSIKIYNSKSQKPLWSQETIKKHRVQVQLANQPLGNYCLEVSDAENKIAKSCYRVLSANSAPALPKNYKSQLTKGNFSKEFKDTIHAAWLYKEADEKWTFQAYQEIADYADNYYPAQLLREQIETGL